MQQDKNLSDKEKTELTSPIDINLSQAYLNAAGSIPAVAESMRRISEAVSQALETYRPMWDQMNHLADTIGKAVIAANQLDFSRITDSIRNLMDGWSSIVQNIQIPTISEERKQQLIENYTEWGMFGWTMHPTEEDLFDKAPSDKKSADAIAHHLCTDKETERLFAVIHDCNRVKKSDLEEAVFLFENRKYKSCALLLFSLIDAQLIRLQKRSSLDKMWRKVGNGAVKAAKARTEEEINTDLLFTALFCANLFACLETVFQNGNDFKKQPDVINRNFLDHGMWVGNVRRKDCVQLFLLYYNMLELLDMIYRKR